MSEVVRMSHPIPQRVDISHALQSSAIEKIRSDIKEFQQVQELSQDQCGVVDQYIESLKVASTQFCKDNEHVERGGDESITAADTQLYNGLKAMYTDYLAQLSTIRSQKNSSKGTGTLEYIVEELPYLQPTDRKSYIDNLILGNKYEEQLDRSPALLAALVDLCVLDSTVTANLRSYMILLRKMGFDDESLRKALPEELLNSPMLSDTVPGAATGKTFTKKIPTDRVGTPPLKEAEEKSTADDEPKKKISFSKYLKKGDVVINENGKRRPSAQSERDESKRLKGDENVQLSSILKTSGSAKKNPNAIKFVDDSLLVKVYGDGLPEEGLSVSPEKLKKILKPFKEGEPRETVLVEGYKGKAPELDTDFDLSPEETDISETKGGSIPCETVVPLKYRLNFASFSSDLSRRPPREPVVVEEVDKKNKGPLIVRAFGKNSLLLRKDRGGLPYKPIPEVLPIDYPSRAP